MNKYFKSAAFLLLATTGAEFIDSHSVFISSVQAATATDSPFQNQVNKEISSNDVGALAQTMASASSENLQGLAPETFSNPTMLGALNNIASNNQEAFQGIVKNISTQAFGSMINGASQANNPGLLTSAMFNGAANQLSGLPAQAFNSPTMTTALANIANNSQATFQRIVQNISSQSFGSMINAATQANNPGLLTAAMFNSSPNQLSGLPPQTFNSPTMIKALANIANNGNPSVFQGIVKNISAQDFGSMINSATKANNTGLLTAAMFNAAPNQLQGLPPEEFNSPSMITSLANIANNNNQSVFQRIVKNISTQAFGSMINGATQANNTGLLTAAMFNSSPNQLQGLPSQEFNSPSMTAALANIANNNNQGVFQGIIKNISAQDFGSLINSATKSNNTGLLTAAMFNSSPNQLQGLPPQEFNSPGMTNAMSNIANNDQEAFQSIVKNISAQAFGSMINGAVQTNNTSLLTASLANAGPNELQGLPSQSLTSPALFNAVSNLYNNNPNAFTRVMNNFSSSQTNSLLSSKGYYYDNGNFYNSTTKQEVNPSSIFPASNTLQAGGNHNESPLSTFNPNQLESKTQAPVESVPTINNQQQPKQIPTGVIPEGKM